MTRSRKTRPRTAQVKRVEARKVVPFPEPTATKSAGLWHAVAAVKIADAGIAAIMAAAAEQGLEGGAWDKEVLRPKIIDLVAHSLLQTPGWLTRELGPKPTR